MKKQRFLFALFMAIVMMAMSPGRAWGHYVLVGNNRYELSEVSIEGSPGLTATIELNKDDEIEIHFCGSIDTPMYPDGNKALTNTGLACDIHDCSGSITVADAGKYKLTFSEFIYTEEQVKHDENDPGTYEVQFAHAHLTIMPLDNHVHSYTEEITSEKSQMIYPTCTAPGVYYKSCVCGDVSTSEDETFEIPARGHNFVANHERVVSAATCTEDAYYVGVCSRCQEESNVRDYGSKLGHNWAAAADGVHHTCQRCETQEEHAFESHIVSESTFISEASCTSAALYHLSCRYCDAISQDDENIFTVGNPLPHTWGDDDKCTVCHNDFNETGDYMFAQVCISGNECLDFSKEDMGANGKKVHIPEGASISVSLNNYYIYPESDLFIEETSYAVNLSFTETDYTNIYVENEGDYIINIRRPYFYIEYIEDEDRYETHASCILSIERHEHSYEDGVCTDCEYACTHSWRLDGVCDICGKECTHDWSIDEDFHSCNICDLDYASHDWSNKDGICTACKYECHHVGRWGSKGVCTYCGYECPGHQYVWIDVIQHCCSICEHLEVHTMDESDHCAVCDNQGVCEHPGWENGICTQCGAIEKPELADDGYYQIANAGNLLWCLNNLMFRDDTEESFVKLTNDIVINNLTFDADGKLEQDKEDLINGHWVIYKCTFDGQGHTISGAFNHDIFAGLFNEVESSTIKNLGLTNSYFHGYNGVGAIAGQANESVIENCWSDAIMIVDEGGECHGFVSQSDDDSQVLNCFSAGTSTIEGIGGNAINCYYLSDEETEDGGKTAEQFASGEVTWLLNKGKTDGTQAWYQKLGTDAAPLLAAAEGNTVYYGVEDCLSEVKYSNSVLYATKAAAHIFGNDKILGDDGYHHPVCTREECDVLSEDKYAKMFGEYRKVTGDENPTATIQMTKVGKYYYTSLYTDFPYTLSSGGAATYTVSDAADGVVTLRDINDVPANCGVIIIGDASECTIEYAPRIYNSGTTDASPLLTGSETDVTSPAAKQYAFGLSDTGYLGFWHWTGMTIPAWSAYLDLGSETVNEAKGFRMVFEDGTTAIEQVPAKASTAEGRYDMMGRKVNDIKGLGIVDGKKVYVK